MCNNTRLHNCCDNTVCCDSNSVNDYKFNVWLHCIWRSSHGEGVCFIVSTCAVTGVSGVRVCRDRKAQGEIRQALGERARLVCLSVCLSQSLGHNARVAQQAIFSSAPCCRLRWLAGVGPYGEAGQTELKTSLDTCC